MVKLTDAVNDWPIVDNARSSSNVVAAALYADLTNVEATGDRCDLLSNGFKWRSTTVINEYNADGGTYIYMAFAEAPFKYANAR